MTQDANAFIADLPFRPRAQIIAVQEAKFAQMLDLCFERHPYYRERFEQMGLRRTDIGSLADIHKIPVISKTDYAAQPDKFRLKTDGLPQEMGIDWDVMHTTGTSSGKPTPFYSTTYDFYNILTTNRRALQIRGVRSTDIVANLCPMTLYPYGAYHRTIAAANAMKIPVISPLPGKPSEYFHWSASTDEVIDAIQTSGATILWGVASFVRRIIIQAQSSGADFSAVRLAFVTGEGVSESLRNDMADRLRALGANDPQINVSYAATEMQVGTVECQPGSGYHNPAPDEFYFEVVDPDSHRPLPAGERGMAVLTHLNRRGTVLLRYLMGDLTVQSLAPCPHCGAHTDRFVEKPTRGDSLVKIKGMLIDPAVLETALMTIEGVGEYQAVIEREDASDVHSMDRFTLLLSETGDGHPLPALDSIAELVRQAIGVRPRVELVSKEAIFDPQTALKSKRLIDRR